MATRNTEVVALVGRDCVTRERVFVRIKHLDYHAHFEGMVVAYAHASVHTWGRIDLRILDRVAPEPLHWMPRDIRVLRGLWRRHGDGTPLTPSSMGELRRLMSLPTGDVPAYITECDGSIVTNP